MIYPVMMAGGVGARFWPLSTPKKPKQFLALLDPHQSMLQLTVNRFSKIFKKENIWIVSHLDFLPLLHRSVSGVKRSQWLLEPLMKNTAPCVGWAAMALLKKDPNAIMVVSPADHWITSAQAFRQDVKQGIRFVKENPQALVTFGIKPHAPETGFGYMEISDKVSGDVWSVGRFVEKPNLVKARRMIRRSTWLWNTGLFIWRADAILQEIRRSLPALYEGLLKIDDTKDLLSIYKRFPAISVDHGILEKSRNVYVIKASFGWTDLGSWKSLIEFKKSRAKRWISLDSKNCFIDARDKKVAVIGVSDLIVIDHPNGLLICHRDHSQRVREVSRYFS